MIGSLPLGTRVWISAGVTDIRKGMDGLAVLVQMALCKGVTVPAGEKGALKNLFAKTHSPSRQS